MGGAGGEGRREERRGDRGGEEVGGGMGRGRRGKRYASGEN